MRLNSLHNSFVDELKDLYSAENQITKALPEMVKAASSPELKEAFQEHLEVTKQQVNRLKEVFKQLDESPGGKTCKGMQGLIEEGSEVMEKNGNASVKDAALIAAAQKIEHYEIAGYGTARSFAETLGLEQVADLLQQTLDEEGDADEKLTEISERINQEAYQEA
jgi:ferritin-like metal-binding protein YciE